MSTATLDADTSLEHEEDSASYRALHGGAIIGLLVALCSLVYPVTVANLTDMQYLLLMAAIPVVALAVCLVSLRAIRANREVYTGERAALAGVLLSAFSLFGGTAYGAYVFSTEVPEGYARSSFLSLRPTDDDKQAGRMIPLPVEELIRSQADVFVKGYIRPSSVQYKRGNREFLLVRDNMECCFGDQSKVMFFDQIQVTMAEGMTCDYKDGVLRTGGKLSVRPGNTAQQEPLIVYSMVVDYVK